MVPPEFVSFFSSMAQCGATLLGLLFVAVSLRRGTGSSDESSEEAVLADAALLAMGNGFIVSAFALLPNVNVGVVALPLSGLALFWVFDVAVRLIQAWGDEGVVSRWLYRVRALGPTVVAFVIAVAELPVAIRLLQNPKDDATVCTLGVIVVGYYSVALLRAWMLVGGARHGIRAVLTSLRATSPPAPPP